MIKDRINYKCWAESILLVDALCRAESNVIEMRTPSLVQVESELKESVQAIIEGSLDIKELATIYESCYFDIHLLNDKQVEVLDRHNLYDFDDERLSDDEHLLRIEVSTHEPF
jgi:hypothetical protein